MSNKRRDIDFLRDIREAIENILTYTKGLDFDGFMRDKKTQDAVVHNLEIIGRGDKESLPSHKGKASRHSMEEACRSEGQNSPPLLWD
jgi:uncharacterized protein with HEPN domain